MKKIILVCLIFLNLSCDDDLSYPGNCPVITTEEAIFEGTNRVSATFRANVLVIGSNYEVVRYGFVYAYFNDKPKLGDALCIEREVSGDFPDDNFEFFMEELERPVGLIYYRAFVETKEVIAYGDIKIHDL